MALGFRSLVSGRSTSTVNSTRSTTATAGASKSRYARRNVLGDRTNSNLNRANSTRYSKYSSRSKTTATSATARPAPMNGVRTSGRAAPLVGRSANPPVAPLSESRLPRPLEDIDVDFDDPQACTEYATDIMNHFYAMEMPYMPPADFMTVQTDVTPKMRAILLDWMVEVGYKFKQLQETMYLTVSVMDRFLSKVQVKRSKLQLVGITSMLVASKVCEMYPPRLSDFIYICDKTYTRREILDMEQLILAKIDFALQPPFPLHFLRRFSKAANANLTTHTTAKYLMELTMPDYEATNFLPSSIAAAAMCLALKMNRSGEWDDTMVHYARYTEEQLEPVVRHLNDLHAKAATTSLRAVYKKYSKKKFLSVALLPAINV